MRSKSIRQMAGVSAVVLLLMLAWSAAPARAGILTPDNNEQLLWLRADAGVTTGTGGVSQWDDQSGHGYNATQSTTTKRPNFSSGTGPNGTDILQFNKQGTHGDWLLVPTAASPAASNTMFVVYNADVNDTGYMFAHQYNKGSWHMMVTGSNEMSHGINNQRTYIQNATGAWNLSTARYDSTVGTQQRLNGGGTQTLATSGNIVYHANDRMAVGAAASTAHGGMYTFSGDIAEIILYDRALTPHEENAVGYYLENKYTVATEYVSPFIHTGQNDPETEGWHKSGSGGVGSGHDDDGEYWNIDCTATGSQTLNYQVDQNDACFTEILNDPHGWYVKATVKVTSGSDESNAPMITVSDGLGDTNCDTYVTKGWPPSTPYDTGDWGDQWALHLKDTGNPATTGVYMSKNLMYPTTTVLLQALDLSEWHTYEMIMTPGATIQEDSAVVKVDGNTVAVVPRTDIFNNKFWLSSKTAFSWGRSNSSQNLNDVHRWSYVEFAVVIPEPSSLVLLAVGGLALIAMLRRRRGR